MGERLHQVLSRSDQNTGFHGGIYLTKGYNGENLVTTLALSFLMGSSSFLQVTMTSIRSRTTSKFCQIRSRTAE